MIISKAAVFSAKLASMTARIRKMREAADEFREHPAPAFDSVCAWLDLSVKSLETAKNMLDLRIDVAGLCDHAVVMDDQCHLCGARVEKESA